MNYGGEVVALEKIKRLESYLSEGLSRYQDVLEEQNRKMPDAPEGIEYRNPGIMESQIFTVLTKRFKSGRLSFSKFGATCLAKICAIKVQEGVFELQEIDNDIEVDTSVEEYIKEIKESIKPVKKALIKLNKNSNEYELKNVNINSKNPIYEIVKPLQLSELDYII